MKEQPIERPAAWWLSQILRRWANQIAARYGAPVYLVGSALREAEPRDIDIRVVLSDTGFVRRYGISAEEPHKLGPHGTDSSDYGRLCARYWTDVAKLGQWASKHHSRGLNFDVQVQSDALAGRYGDERVRLDDVPLDAASGHRIECRFEKKHTWPAPFGILPVGGESCFCGEKTWNLFGVLVDDICDAKLYERVGAPPDRREPKHTRWFCNRCGTQTCALAGQEREEPKGETVDLRIGEHQSVIQFLRDEAALKAEEWAKRQVHWEAERDALAAKLAATEKLRDVAIRAGFDGIAAVEEKLIEANRRLSETTNAIQDDLAAALRAAGLSDHARNASPHEVMVYELIPAIAAMRARIGAEP